jgi:hypothetical protein
MHKHAVLGAGYVKNQEDLSSGKEKLHNVLVVVVVMGEREYTFQVVSE